MRTRDIIRRLFAIVVLTATLGAQQSQEPPPGNPDHTAPGEGEFCTVDSPNRDLPDGAKPCVCHEWRKCFTDPQTGERVVVEHVSCTVYCFKDHCKCPMHCEDTEE